MSKDSVLAVQREIQNATSLEGNKKYDLLRTKQEHSWIKSRQNVGLEILEKKKDATLAIEIFNAWDVRGQGYLSFQEVCNHLIGLGLADDQQFVQNLLLSVISSTKNGFELLTMTQFLKVFEFDKFGELACKQLRKEMQEK